MDVIDMPGLIEHIIRASGHKLRTHAYRFAGLPEKTVESAAVSDEQTTQWSNEMYAKDLEEDRRYPPRALALAGFLMLLVAGVGTAAIAKADPRSEVAFIAVLDQNGIGYPTPAYAIRAGYQVCGALYQGLTEMQAATAIFTNSALTAYQSGYFVGAAEAAFCPDMIPSIYRGV